MKPNLFSNQCFQICWLIRGMDVIKNPNKSAHYSKIIPAGPKTTGTWGMNDTITNEG